MKEQMELFNEGGLRDEGGTVEPESGNEVPSGSLQKEVADDIPAMLSDGEFVMTAQAVRNAGGGSRKVGAKNMYKMMKSLENGGSLSQQSIGMA